jgi:predicted DNA-binding transcriptional regulator AlpA
MTTDNKAFERLPLEPKLRTPDAARYLGLAPATLCRRRVVGGGPRFTRLGRAVVYDRTDLDSWCDAQGKLRSTSDAGAASGP